MINKNFNNMKKKSLSNKSDRGKILFILNTEFTLLIAILHYLKNLSQTGEAIFVLLKSKDGRFNNINFDHLPGKYYLFHNDMTESVIFPDKQFEQVLHLENITHIVFQHPYDLLTQVIIRSYLNGKKDISLTLISDGLVTTAGLSKKDKLRLTLKLLFRKYFNGYKLLSLKKYNMNMQSYLDCLIADKNMNMDCFILSSDLILHINKQKELIKNIFNFHYGIEHYANYKILFFTQPIEAGSLFNAVQKGLYTKVLYELSNLAKVQKIPMLLKIHPQENANEYKIFTNDFVTIDDSTNVPAEIILNLIHKKIIISMFSSISLYENKQNKHFWLNNLMNYNIKNIEIKKFINSPDNFTILQNEILQYLNEAK